MRRVIVAFTPDTSINDDLVEDVMKARNAAV
jgi:hypothetical protein